MRGHWRPSILWRSCFPRWFSSCPSAMARNYAAAIAALNSLQTNFAIVDALKKTQTRQEMNERSVPEMIEWVKRIGYQPSDLGKLNPVHVAGTKGKGSTSAFISSILSQYTAAKSTGSEKSSCKINKIGVYTSPHLRFARERIQIDNTPLSEEQFARYFFEVWDRLEKSASIAGQDPADPMSKPQYFRYLTLMAFHVYMSEGVDAAVIECGIGGEYDATNVIERPVVSAIASLGIDHTSMLGSTIEEIAWHKSGIMKPSVKTFTATQLPGAEKVLFERAKEKGATLEVVRGHPELNPSSDVKLGLAGDFQYINAAVAVAAAAEFLRKVGVEGIPRNILTEPLPSKFRKGLEETRLGGRCETRKEKNMTWCVDGGHTLESIRLAGQWFASQMTRDSVALARALYETLIAALGSEHPFTHAIFCTNVTYKVAGYRPDLVSMNINATDVKTLRIQHTLAETWKTMDPSAQVEVFNTIEETVDFARDVAAANRGSVASDETPALTFVTGSLHLVGGFLDVIETKPAAQNT